MAKGRVVTPSTRLIFIDNPNNPTGTLLSRERLETFLAGLPDHLIVALDVDTREKAGTLLASIGDAVAARTIHAGIYDALRMGIRW